MKHSNSLIIPFRNEEQHLPTALNALHRDISSDLVTNLILVDDGSEDGSMREIQTYLNKYKDIRKKSHIIQHETNLGKGAALIDGFEQAIELGDDFMITIDADTRYIGKGLLKKGIKKMKQQKNIDMTILYVYCSKETLNRIRYNNLLGKYIEAVPPEFSGQRMLRTSHLREKIFSNTNIRDILYSSKQGVEYGLNLLTKIEKINLDTYKGIKKPKRKNTIISQPACKHITGKEQRKQRVETEKKLRKSNEISLENDGYLSEALPIQ